MAKKPKGQYKKGYFDYDTLTVKFGTDYDKPEFKFTAQAIHVPPYKYQVYEREDAGGGWYGAKTWVEYEAKYVYIIVKDGLCIGFMSHPYHDGIKSELLPINDKTDKQIVTFFKSLNLPYKHYISNKEPLQLSLKP